MEKKKKIEPTAEEKLDELASELDEEALASVAGGFSLGNVQVRLTDDQYRFLAGMPN